MRDPLHFDRVADDYDAVRPGYPEDFVGRVLAEAGAVGDALELGCGSGQLTTSLARRGLNVHAVDIGASLIERARRRLADQPWVTFERADLRHWSPPRTFDLVIAATAFHWLGAPLGFRLGAEALRPGGTLAILRHDHPLPLTGFHRRAQRVYREVFPDGPDLELQPSDEARIAALAAEFAAEPRLGPVRVLTRRWTRSYDHASYVRLLRTYSDHASLPAASWQRLVQGLGALIDEEYGGVVERPYLTVAWLAQRL